ncbi:something about silencing protein 10 [Passer montanus]|uniref:something about silencing protein 10 n=1 Tax=Passer montanus TaxID=9160 RepID=UPI001960D49D|nr:something about silencing protein 10 [Passer montanus]
MRTRRGTVLRPRAEPAEPPDDPAEVPGGRAGPEELADDVERFHEEQFRAVMAALDSGEEAGDSEEEEEEEEVLGLQLPDDSEEEEEEDEEDEEDELQDRNPFVEYSAEEDEDGEDEEGEEDENDIEDGEEEGGEEDKNGVEDEEGDLSMESDLEERHPEAKLPHELSWGQRKQLYYDTDYGNDAQAKGKRTQQEIDAEEEEEEQEAQVIQRRLVRDLGEDDYGLDMIQGYLAKQQKTHDSKGQKIDKDLQALSKKEQLKLLKQESPELLQLMEDFEVKLMEIKDELHPLLQMVRDGTIPQGKGSRYLQTKYHLYLNYCANISFCLVLKSKRMPVHSHPVIERLVEYRNLINDLAVIDQKLSPQVRMLLRNYYDKKEEKLRKENKFSVFLTMNGNKTKPKRAPAPVNGQAAAESSDESELDEEAALKYYRMMEEKLELKRKRTGDEDVPEEAEVSEGEDPSKKRGVTYQMIKNKGLTPKRRKIDRNPRVKHREKFRRAKIRRKGQVREVRRELHRYAGELSGIRAGVKKSRKLK